MRLFIAILIPPEVKAALERLQRQLRAQLPDAALRWVTPDNFHFTLLFLGEQPEERLCEIERAMHSAVQSIAPFEVAVGGLGVFPNWQRPAVLWVGTQAGAEPMSQIATYLERALVGRADKPFHAHLTLARIKLHREKVGARHASPLPLPTRLQTVVDALQPAPVGHFTVKQISLMQSELHSSGARYSELRAVPLG